MSPWYAADVRLAAFGSAWSGFGTGQKLVEEARAYRINDQRGACLHFQLLIHAADVVSYRAVTDPGIPGDLFCGERFLRAKK